MADRSRCKTCRYWSEMITRSTEDGLGTEAMCISSDGPKNGTYTRSGERCTAHMTGEPVDMPPQYLPGS